MTTFPAFFEQVPGITVHDPLAGWNTLMTTRCLACEPNK